MEEMGVVLEEMGRAVHPGPFLSSALAAVWTIRRIGTERDRAELLPSLASGERIGTLAGIHLGPPKIEAKKTPDGFVLSGLEIVPDGLAADLILVPAILGSELGLFAVDASRAALEPLLPVDRTKKLAELRLDATLARRIGEGDARAALIEATDRITLGLVAEAVGAADRALEIATEYAKIRRQFDRPIGAFQAVQHKLADMLRDLELARSGVYEALRLADLEGSETAFHRAVASTKAYAGEALHRVTADAIQVLGGIGFTWEHDAHLYLKRAMSMQHSYGESREHLAEYARLLLD
jgi:alkylation response protein AidB-like acyl-CoA dehydrogenase